MINDAQRDAIYEAANKMADYFVSIGLKDVGVFVAFVDEEAKETNTIYAGKISLATKIGYAEMIKNNLLKDE